MDVLNFLLLLIGTTATLGIPAVVAVWKIATTLANLKSQTDHMSDQLNAVLDFLGFNGSGRRPPAPPVGSSRQGGG